MSATGRYLLAKEQGYRSRAAFKLIQLNKKYNLLSAAKSVLDLGAAPGGWLQVCSRYMPVSSLLLGVDLLPIKPVRGVTTIQADITTPECKTLIKKELQGWDVDLVLCDSAPNVAGGTVVVERRLSTERARHTRTAPRHPLHATECQLRH